VTGVRPVDGWIRTTLLGPKKISSSGGEVRYPLFATGDARCQIAVIGVIDRGKSE